MFDFRERKKEEFRLLRQNMLKPLSSKKLKSYDLVGFDIETFGDSNDFDLGGLYYELQVNRKRLVSLNNCSNMRVEVLEESKNWVRVGIYEFYWDLNEYQDRLMRNDLKGKRMIATNLGFDLIKTYEGSKYWNGIGFGKSGSDVAYAIYKAPNSNKKGKTYFLDTMSYDKKSVEDWGKILKMPKLNRPSHWVPIYNEKGDFMEYKVPKAMTDKEKEELLIYNMMDCKISRGAGLLLQEGFNDAGGNMKVTIASTALDIWRRNFLERPLLKEDFVLKTDWVRDFIFKSYYGGRTENFMRFDFKNVFYYDVNSLYPSVMKNNVFPLPQSAKIPREPSRFNIDNYEGFSEVEIECPSGMNRPILPVRIKGKNLNPGGLLRGVYAHPLLRFALRHGYKIHKIIKQVYYTETFSPFSKFVDYHYDKRMKLKAEGSSMEIVPKLIMNSLYGKFAMKQVTKFEVRELKYMTEKEKKEFCGDDIVEITPESDKIFKNIKKKWNGHYSFPVFSSYVTSYAQILMYPYLNDPRVIYTDTDSVFTTEDMGWDSKVLGEMKCEGAFPEGYFIRPKMYRLIKEDGKPYCKMKGIPRPNTNDFDDVLNERVIRKVKLMKISESIRRNVPTYSRADLIKKINLHDNKRVWDGVNSSPIIVDLVGGENMTSEMREDMEVKIARSEERKYLKVVNDFIKSKPYIRKKYGTDMGTLRDTMLFVVSNGGDLDLYDWYSLDATALKESFSSEYGSAGLIYE